MSRAYWRGVPAALAAIVLSALVPGVARAQVSDDFFNDATLQEVRLAVNSNDWQMLKDLADENTYYPADLTWKGVTVRNIGIRSRGNGTRNGIKPGLRVDFNRYLTNQEFLGLKAVILDNVYSDASSIRESVAMKLYARVGLPTVREAHVRLYVNNEYIGLYVIVESVDRTFISRLFGAAEANTETGGYLFEYKWQFYWNFEYLGPNLDTYAALFRPQTRDTDAVSTIYTPIEGLVRAVNESSDQDFASAVGAYLDLTEVMKYLAVETFTTEWDGLAGNWSTNNFYLYRFKEGGVSQLIPWDKDHAFTFLDVPIMYRLGDNVLTRRALAVPALRQVFLDTLLQCATIASETDPNDPRGFLEREVARQAQMIAASVTEDPVYPFTVDQFLTDVDFLTQFAQTRSAFVQCDVARTEDPSAECPSPSDQTSTPAASTTRTKVTASVSGTASRNADPTVSRIATQREKSSQ
jgi:hypothetical protein